MSGTKPPPSGPMRVVSENSPADLAKNAAMQKVDRSLRELAANLMRVARGSGNAREMPQQAQDFIDAVVAYQDAAGRDPPPGAMAEVLRVSIELEARQHWSDARTHMYHAEHDVLRGALQLAASRLLGQRLQDRAGESLMLWAPIRLWGCAPRC
jgi:hypothetical protein